LLATERGRILYPLLVIVSTLVNVSSSVNVSSLVTVSSFGLLLLSRINSQLFYNINSDKKNEFIFLLRYRISCIINPHSSGNDRVGDWAIFSGSYGSIGISLKK
jgi:hypothetical protein